MLTTPIRSDHTAVPNVPLHLQGLLARGTAILSNRDRTALWASHLGANTFSKTRADFGVQRLVFDVGRWLPADQQLPRAAA